MQTARLGALSQASPAHGPSRLNKTWHQPGPSRLYTAAAEGGAAAAKGTAAAQPEAARLQPAQLLQVSRTLACALAHAFCWCANLWVARYRIWCLHVLLSGLEAGHGALQPAEAAGATVFSEGADEAGVFRKGVDVTLLATWAGKPGTVLVEGQPTLKFRQQ
mmetsp:Transcript_17533/g.48415  ORF Transcript_17533/g.48415 Transcript_17533/m.48415 type:complete len:162 (-) Transcript_17533:1060-1545(-)